MSAALARYLQDFSEPQSAPVPMVTESFGGGFGSDIEDDFTPPPIIEDPVDLEAERAEAFAQGQQAAIAEMEQRFVEEKQAMTAAHAEELAALRQKFESETAVALAAGLQEIATTTAQAVSDQTARILSPLLDEAIVAKAMSDMAEIIRAAILDGELAAVTVRGPRHLFFKLKKALGETTAALRHVEAPDLDIAVDIGESALVTRMSAWSASLKKVLG